MALPNFVCLLTVLVLADNDFKSFTCLPQHLRGYQHFAVIVAGRFICIGFDIWRTHFGGLLPILLVAIWIGYFFCSATNIGEAANPGPSRQESKYRSSPRLREWVNAICKPDLSSFINPFTKNQKLFCGICEIRKIEGNGDFETRKSKIENLSKHFKAVNFFDLVNEFDYQQFLPICFDKIVGITPFLKKQFDF